MTACRHHSKCSQPFRSLHWKSGHGGYRLIARVTRGAAKLSRLLHFAVVKRHDGKNLGNGLLLFFPSFTALYSGPEESASILLPLLRYPVPSVCANSCMPHPPHTKTLVKYYRASSSNIWCPQARPDIWGDAFRCTSGYW